MSGCLNPVPAAPGSDHYFDSYVYTTPLGDIPLTRDRVVYDWRMSAKDPYQPESVLQSAMLPVKLAAACDHYMWGLISQGMVASKMVITNDFEEADHRRAWEDQFNSNFTGYDNAGKVLFTYADNEYSEDGKLVDAANVQVIDLSMKSVDAQLLDMVKQAKIDIEVALGVPESLIGNACLKSDEWVRLADGSRRRAADLVGSTFEVLTSTSEGPAKRDAYATWNAVEPTFVVETESGRRLMCNSQHPLFAGNYTRTKDAHWKSDKGPRIDVRGWTRVGDLATGDLLAVSTEFPSEGAPYDLDAAKVLGYLIGDGCCGSTPGSGERAPITFAAERSVHSDDFAHSVGALGDTVRRYKTSGVPVWGVAGGAVRKLLEAEGLLGSRGHNKHIPVGIWGANREAQREFLSRLYATDGYASLDSPGKTKDGRGHAHYGSATITLSTISATITLSTISRDLASDVQELLLRFGIASRIEGQLAALGIAKRRSYIYHVQVTVAEDVILFADTIGIYGKEPAVAACRAHAVAQIGRGRTPKWRTRHLNPGLRWEKITSIEPLGIDATVCVTVPEGNTYLSTFWEHNSQRVFANADSEYRAYWTTTALADVAELEDAVNLWLAPELDSTEVGWFDLSQVVALQPPSVFAPPMVTDMLNAGVIDVADVAKILNLPAVEAPGEDVSTAPIGEEAIQSGIQGGRSFLYRASHRGAYHPGEGYRAVHHGMRLAENVFVKRLPLNRYTLDSGVWHVEQRRERAITVRSLPVPVRKPPLAIDLVAKADRNRQYREAGYRAAPKLVASGLVVKAADTGRVLMLQRRFDDDKDPARGKWDWPGGRLEPGEDSFDGAQREWEEEIGQRVPHGNIAGSWTSPSGIHRGHVLAVPHETDVPVNVKPKVKNPDNPKGKYTETAAWFHLDHIADNPAVRDEVRKTADTWKPVVEMAQSINEVGGRSLPSFEDFGAFSRRLEALVS